MAFEIQSVSNIPNENHAFLKFVRACSQFFQNHEFSKHTDEETHIVDVLPLSTLLGRLQGSFYYLNSPTTQETHTIHEAKWPSFHPLCMSCRIYLLFSIGHEGLKQGAFSPAAAISQGLRNQKQF